MGKKKINEKVLCNVCKTGAYMSLAGIPVTALGFLTNCAPVKIGGIIATDVGVVVRAVSDVLLEKCANVGIDYHYADSNSPFDDDGEQLDVDIYLDDIDDDDNTDTYFEQTLNEAINKKEKKSKKKSEEIAEEADAPVKEEE